MCEREMGCTVESWRGTVPLMTGKIGLCLTVFAPFIHMQRGAGGMTERIRSTRVPGSFM
jgi:hypothetical protein